ncbi:SDR family NAD(P)-dependent oxidoreductase [Methyloceanibacter caenitepidi]|uniref:Short-chain dehydrogenase/reductase SDR n=1 Tax=Methyloceanibacter caenitepidi TaxID=1384459 RepID=A0A0A8K696_9HYPH|nr:SDR family NAD(P)-dependent oxidoreductase [Methyloceanibacter caenitepidi]BAQ18410.1 short-chain dehydrogenase/reductase SDR [Methyloceanibacter caenitepidi]
MSSKLVVVTGASSGIGEATARRFGQAGAHVVLLARNADRLERAAHEVRAAGGTATALAIDLQNRAETLDAAARISGDIGTPDLLVNNAGIGRWRPLVETGPDEAAAMIGVPYLAAFNLTRAFVPAMIERGSGGIAFVTSPASYLAWPNASAYIAARRAIAGFAESLQSELKTAGIVVTIVVLGTVETPYFDNNPGSRENIPELDSRLAPVLTADQAAEALFQGTEQRKRFVVKPGIYRALFVMNALFPKTVASQIRRAAKKGRRTGA